MDNKEKQIFLIRLEDDIEINIAYNAVMDYRKKYEDDSLTELDIAPKTIPIEKNLVLYKNGVSPFFWCRFKVNGLEDYVRKSTKKRKVIDAAAEAKLIKFKITEQVKAGTYHEKDVITWRKVCIGAIKDLQVKAAKAKEAGEKKSSSQGYLSIIQTYYLSIEQWRDIDIKSFGYRELNQLKELDSFKDMPKTTATKRKTALKEIFEYAILNKIIEKRPDLPTFDYIKGEEGTPFSIDDRDVIMSNFINFLESGKQNYITKHKRTILPLYVNFLILTGVRPGEEALNINWDHITKKKTKNENNEDKNFYSLEITKGKRSKRVKRNNAIIHTSRGVVIGYEVTSTLERLYYVMNGVKKGIDEIIKENTGVQIFLGNTEADLEMGSTFSQYMDYLGKKVKHKYTLYSCRHEHINICLEKKMNIDDIAVQCGTSSKTIDTHYKKFRHENRAIRILGQDDIDKLNPNID
jgi:integrase